jgi:hypothetical protein
MIRWRWWGVAAALWASAVLADEQGFTLRDVEVKAKPFLDAAAVGKVPARTAITVIERQGGWARIKVGATAGWVRLLTVRLGNPDPAKNDTAFLASLGVGKQRSASGPTATTGVRGFSEEDLKAARPDPEQLGRMDGFAVTAARAADFAAAGKLSAQAVPYVTTDGKSGKEAK